MAAILEELTVEEHNARVELRERFARHLRNGHMPSTNSLIDMASAAYAAGPQQCLAVMLLIDHKLSILRLERVPDMDRTVRIVRLGWAMECLRERVLAAA